MGTPSPHQDDEFKQIQIEDPITGDVANVIDDNGVKRLAVEPGEVTTIPGIFSDIIIENAKLSGSADMRVDGSSAAKLFTINSVSGKNIFISELRFYGGGNGIKFERFLSQNSELTTGIQITIKSDDNTTVLPLIKTTEDFKNKFAFGSGDNFRLDVQAGGDQFLAVFLAAPFVIKETGTFGTDDFIEVKIQDDLSSGLSELELIAKGVERDV